MSEDAQLSDGELCIRVREGNPDAFGTLYERHAPLALSIARQAVDNNADAEDVVADAFHAVLDKLRSGDGPDTFFRAYLLQVVRRTAYARNRSAGRAIPTADEQQLDRPETPEDPALIEFESQAAATAFRALPERWQEVLWYVDVEGQKPAAVAPILGLAPNAVSALAVRARDALRREYLQAHVSGEVPEECRPYRDKLGAYVRGSLSRGAERKVREHLDRCAKCTAIVVELGDVRATIKAVLLPLIIGAGPAAWWLSPAGQTAVLGSLGGGLGGLSSGALAGSVSGSAGAGAAGGSAAGGSAAGGTASGGAAAGAGALGIGAAVAGVAVVAVGLVLAPSLVANLQAQPKQPTAYSKEAVSSTSASAQATPSLAKPREVRPTTAKPVPKPAPKSVPGPADVPHLPAPLLPVPVALSPGPPHVKPVPGGSTSPAASPVPTPSDSETPTGPATPTETETPTPTGTETATETETPTESETPTETDTETETPTDSPSETDTPTQSETPTETSTTSWCPPELEPFCQIIFPGD